MKNNYQLLHLQSFYCPFPNKPLHLHFCSTLVFWKHSGKRRNCYKFYIFFFFLYKGQKFLLSSSKYYLDNAIMWWKTTTNFSTCTAFITLSQTSPCSTLAFWKHCGKRRNCSLRAISPFSHSFFYPSENFPSISSNLKMLSANSLSLEECKIYHFRKGQPFPKGKSLDF